MADQEIVVTDVMAGSDEEDPTITVELTVEDAGSGAELVAWGHNNAVDVRSVSFAFDSKSTIEG